ncbi:MAG: hypothetical protein ABMA13_18065 [Chthoniobacteraceae bacterium]
MSALALDTALSDLPDLATECVLIGSGQRADCIWTRGDFIAICEHMLNGNSPQDFMLVYRNRDDKPCFAKAKTPKASRRTTWAWDTIIGRTKSPVGIGFYPTNPDGQSRWGAMDFDAHDGSALRARALALEAFRLLLRHPQLYLALGTSGSDGWHLFVFSREFHPTDHWTLLLKQVAAFIGTEVKPGICEVFPNDIAPGSWGHGIRAPGTWNPKTGGMGTIAYDGLSPLLAEKKEKRKESPFLYHATDSVAEARLHDKRETGLPGGPDDDWTKRFAITLPATRHHQLKALVLHVFHQVGHSVARHWAESQHQSANPTPQADLAEHMDEFEELWRWKDEQWQQELPDGERARFEALPTQTQRDVFRIVRSFVRKGEQDDSFDFPFPVENVGMRVGVSYQAMSKLRRHFMALRFIELTARHIPNVRATRFRWLAADETEDPF